MESRVLATIAPEQVGHFPVQLSQEKPLPLQRVWQREVHHAIFHILHQHHVKYRRHSKDHKIKINDK
jgi:hypothetical protein